MLGKGWSDDAVLVRNQVSVPSLLFLAVGLIVFSPNQQEAAHERQEPPGGTTTNSTKYATPDEVQAALERGREVLAKHQVAVDPVVQRIRDLAKQRCERKDAEIQGYRRRQHAKQEREDKAIENFRKWNPASDRWLM